MISRLSATITFLLTMSGHATRAQVRFIEGTYRNPAEGYSVKIPRGLKGKTGNQAGPERGVSIALPSGGTISVFGEPNSLEWATPEEGVTSATAGPDCTSEKPVAQPAQVGKLRGSQTTYICGDRVVTLVLAFRPRGGPIYWFRLDTTPAHKSEDEAILSRLGGGFRLIPWQ